MINMKNSDGYSFVEMLVVVLIFMIVIALMVPSQKFFLETTRIELVADELYDALQMARHEAMMRHRSVVVSRNGEWRNGLTIKMGRQVLYSHRFSLPSGHLFWRAFPRETDDLIFLSSGFSKIQNGTFWFCLAGSKNPSWAIVLNQSGRVRKVLPDGAGRIYDDRGRLLTCFSE